ncbi:MAG TPA: hypothetical protein VM915_12150 [Verrucomicrobiae bacterium]|jgi:hypothetical protein|nr:hypothetical protein [Verrucomicrobiae bacterium]
MPKQANVMQWVAIGAVAGAAFYVAQPMPGPSLVLSALTGLIGGALLGGFAAGIRNLFGPK